MNQVVLVGRLTKDAELTYLPNVGTPKVTFMLAVDREYKKKDGSKETDFIPIEFMGKIAETTAKYVSKGSLVGVSGNIRIDRYEDNEGNRRTFTKVFGNTIKFLSTSKDKEQNENVEFVPNFNPNEFQTIDDDDVPF